MESETISCQTISQELKEIRKELKFIKEHMIDVDMIVTPEEETEIREAMDEYQAGKSIAFDELEKELGY